MTREEIEKADRATLQAYLESWGGAVYDHEPLEDVRAAALENHKTEGDGWGPMERGYPQNNQAGK